MSLFSSIGGAFGAGGDAADIFEKFAREGIGELRRQFDVTRGDISPFMQAGQMQVPGLAAAATIPGFSGRLGDLFKSGALQPLIDERTRAAQGQLAAGGLTRSGTALREIADIPTELGLGIESMLQGRSQTLADRGLESALGLGKLGQMNAQSLASLLAGIGGMQSSGLLGDAQSGSDLFGQALSGLGSIGLAAKEAGGLGDLIKSIF